MIDLFKVITAKDRNSDILIAAPRARLGKKNDWAFAVVSPKRKMMSGFRSRNAIDTIFAATGRTDLKLDKGKRLFFEAIFVPHNYNFMEDWLPIIQTIKGGA